MPHALLAILVLAFCIGRAAGQEDLGAVPGEKSVPRLLAQMGHSQRLNGANFSGDGRTILSTGRDNSLKLWDVASGLEITSLFA
jgi:WD40 repeat protein